MNSDLYYLASVLHALSLDDVTGLENELEAMYDQGHWKSVKTLLSELVFTLSREDVLAKMWEIQTSKAHDTFWIDELYFDVLSLGVVSVDWVEDVEFMYCDVDPTPHHTLEELFDAVRAEDLYAFDEAYEELYNRKHMDEVATLIANLLYNPALSVETRKLVNDVVGYYTATVDRLMHLSFLSMEKAGVYEYWEENSETIVDECAVEACYLTSRPAH